VPRLTVLVTCREPLSVPADQAQAVEPVRLFVDRARAASRCCPAAAGNGEPVEAGLVEERW
jgi:hypothetical protein